MILCFADNGHDESLLREFNGSKKELNENFPLILFVFKNTTKKIKDYEKKFFDITYLKCINMNDVIANNKADKAKIKEMTIFYLYHILKKKFHNYYNEEGYKIIDEIDPLSKMALTGIYLPVFLIGNPGMGKSTFINVIAGERISKATSSVEPVTSKAAYYDVLIPGEENTQSEIKNKLLNEDAYFRFIDTPGFDQKKDVDISIKEVNNIFDAFEKGKERIPIILYFLQSGRSFGNESDKKEKTLKLLRFLKTKKAKIIFIITRCHDDEEEEWAQTPSFKEFLETNNLKELVEYDDSNIITCNLVGRSAFGMIKIFKKMHAYLNLVDGNLVYNESLIQGIKARPTFTQKLEYIKQKTHLFDMFETKEDIIAFANIKSTALITSFSVIAACSGAIPFPFADVGIMIALIGTMIIKIASFYGYAWRKISKRDIAAILNGEKYVKIDDDEDEYTNADKSEIFPSQVVIFDLIKGILMSSFITTTSLLIDDAIKVIPIIGTLFGCLIGSALDFGMIILYGKRANNYFRSKCEADDGTLFFCVRCHEYEVIFKKMNEFDEKYITYPKS